MGNSCLHLYKEVSTCDRKTRLTKELKDIYPMRDDSLKRQFSNANDYLREQTCVFQKDRFRVDGEDTCMLAEDPDEDTLMELDELIREVSFEEATGEEMTMGISSTSLEISSLLSELEGRKYLYTEYDERLYDEKDLCERKDELFHVDMSLNISHIQQTPVKTKEEKDYNNNTSIEEEVTFLLDLLGRDPNNTHIETKEFNVTPTNTRTHTTTNNLQTTTIDREKMKIKERTTVVRTQNPLNDHTVITRTKKQKNQNENINDYLDIKREDPTTDSTYCQSTVIDTYLQDIDETFSKTDEIQYLLALLENNTGRYNTKTEINNTDDTIMSTPNNNCNNNIPRGQTYTKNECNMLLTPKTTDVTAKQINPTRSIHNEITIPPRNPKETHKNTGNIQSVMEAMDFVCQLICSDQVASIDHRVDRSTKSPPNEIQYLLAKLENGYHKHTPDEDNRMDTIIPHKQECIPIINNLKNDKQNKQFEDSKSKTKNTHTVSNKHTVSNTHTVSNKHTKLDQGKRRDNRNDSLPVTDIAETDSADNTTNKIQIEYLLTQLDNTEKKNTSKEPNHDIESPNEVSLSNYNISSNINSNINMDINNNLLVNAIPTTQKVISTQQGGWGRNGQVKQQNTTQRNIMNNNYTTPTDKTNNTHNEKRMNQSIHDTEIIYENLMKRDEIAYLLSLFEDGTEYHVTGHETTNSDDVMTKNNKLDNVHENMIDNSLLLNKKKLLDKCKRFEFNTYQNIDHVNEYDLSGISLTYRLQHYKKNILLHEDEFSEQTKTMKNGLHLYTRGLQARSLSPCYEQEDEYSNADIRSLDQLIEQLAIGI